METAFADKSRLNSKAPKSQNTNMFPEINSCRSQNALRAEAATQTDDYGCINGCLSIYVTMTTVKSKQPRQTDNNKQLSTDSSYKIHQVSALESHKTFDANPLAPDIMQECSSKNLTAGKQESTVRNLVAENKARKKKWKASSNSKSELQSNYNGQNSNTISSKRKNNLNTLSSSQLLPHESNLIEMSSSMEESIVVASNSIPLIQKRHSKLLVDTMFYKEGKNTAMKCHRNENGNNRKTVINSMEDIVFCGGSYTNIQARKRHITTCHDDNHHNDDDDQDSNNDEDSDVYNYDDSVDNNNDDDSNDNDDDNDDDEVSSSNIKYQDLITNNNNASTNNAKKSSLEVKFLEIFDEDSSATIELPQNAVQVNLVDDTNNLHCSMCNVECLSKLHLEEHIAIAHDKPFKCQTCEKRFKQHSSLAAHLNIHSGEKLYKCTKCDKCYTQRCHLSDHLRTHLGIKLFKCNVCGKDFGQRSHLKGHLRTHTDERPYQCEICSKTFQFRSVLNQHLKIHSGVKPFSCPHCDKTFRQGSHLKVHLKIHLGLKPFECTLCGKRFREKTHLILHNRSHTGERPYPCKVCGRMFRSSSDVATHMKSHTNNKPLCCTVCLKRFATRRGLKEHSKRHATL